MASDRNDANDQMETRSLHGANIPAVTNSIHFPTDREFVYSQINPRELTFQPLTDHSLHPTRQTGFMNLREKLLHIFQEEAERACREDPKYKTLTLKGRLSLTVNNTQKVFIDIFDLYPHQNDATNDTGEPLSLSAPLDPLTDPFKSNTVEKVSPDIGLSSSLIDRVTSLGQVELLRRYNANQAVNEEHSQLNFLQQSDSDSTTKQTEVETSHVQSISPQSSLVYQDHGDRSITGDTTESINNKPEDSNQQEDCFNNNPTISDQHDEIQTNNSTEAELSESVALVLETENPDSLKCYLCKDVLPDRMSFLLHVEKHCQTLAQKCLEDNSPNTLYHHLKDSGISVTDIIKPELEVSASQTTKTTKKSTKSPKPTKTKNKSVSISYIEDADDDFEDNTIDSYSDDEKNDPSFIEEIVRMPAKRKGGPSTRSRAKTLTQKQKSEKSNIKDSSTENSEVVDQINPEDIPDLPLPKNMKHTNTGLAPFIARPVKKKTVLKKVGSKPTPKMSLKIRMKEKAKALAIKTANQVTQIVDLECKECQKKFTNRKAYFRHIRRHDIKKCVCDICGKEFSTLDSLSHHQRGLHNAIKPYSCEECGKSFNFHHSYKLHKQKHSGSRPYKCDHCGKSYLTSSHLKAHQTAVHSQLKKDKFICSICGKAFNYQNSLKTHLMIHSGERPYKCEKCQKGFVSRQALRTHETSYHVTSKNYKCDVCNKFYKSEMLLNVHKRRHTTDVSRFMCDICGRQFMFKSNLESHKYVHQEGRPFSCDTCGKSFKCMSSLYTHQYTHKQDTPFKCKLCGKGFKTKNCCKAHERRHSAEKSFICSTCGSCFPDKGGLSKHVRTIHNPQKHFVCKLCNKVGTRADNMRTHVKSHGKDIGQDNIENFIVEVLNADGMQVIEQATKITPNKVKPSVGQYQSPDPQPASTINYSQMEMYQPAATLQNHGASGGHQEDPHHVLQHYSSHGHTMLTHHNIQHGHPGSSHPGTPPITQSNNSMTPPITHTPTPQIPQSMSPPVMQVNPSTAYTTLHPLTTEALVMSGLSGQYPPLYTPYKQQ